jgi:hypothetical protein
MYLEKVTNRNLKKKNSDVAEKEIVDEGTKDEQTSEESK